MKRLDGAGVYATAGGASPRPGTLRSTMKVTSTTAAVTSKARPLSGGNRHRPVARPSHANHPHTCDQHDGGEERVLVQHEPEVQVGGRPRGPGAAAKRAVEPRKGVERAGRRQVVLERVGQCDRRHRRTQSSGGAERPGPNRPVPGRPRPVQAGQHRPRTAFFGSRLNPSGWTLYTSEPTILSDSV